LLDYLHFAGAEPPCLDAADADDSGRLDLADALVLMNFLFLAGQALPPPGTRTPWFDPTGDDLSCGG
jgi:hypothetical protein